MKVTTQIELEKQNLDITIQRTMNEINKASQSKSVSDLKQSHNIIPFYVTELNDKLQAYMYSALLGQARVKPVPAKALSLLPTEVVAHFTVKSVMNHIGKIQSAPKLYTVIAKALEVEFNLSELGKKNPKAYETTVNYLKKSTYSGARLQKITGDLLAKYHKEILSRDLSHVWMQVAQLAITILAECQPMIGGELMPNLIVTTAVKEKNAFGEIQNKSMIIPGDWVLEWMKQQTLDGNMLPNYHTAMIEVPRPWTDLRNGGFYTDHFRCNFIKTNVDPAKFKVWKMKRTMEAVNRIQETPWEVNTEVMDVMLYAFENKLNWGDLASPEEVLAMPYPYPDKTRDQLTEEQKAEVKNWATHKTRLHDEFHAEVSRYLSVSRVLNEAKRFMQYEQIYFAYQVDFRGRIYPIAANLHPQGASYVKALLRFKNGKVISNQEAETYLAVQGANTYGEDKVRMEDKLGWVKRNEANILQAAVDPINSVFWKQASEPWSFLAFCFEWRGYKNDPSNFQSKLPVALDGSCNGLQHLSAMLRDEVGGREVNLTANYNKRDIYGAVQELVIKALGRMDNALAHKILAFGVERSTCKRPVMIMPYAGTQSSCREYVMDDFVERGGHAFFGDEMKAAVSLTSAVIWESIGCVVIKGREIMHWFKKNARLAAKKASEPELHWETPNGFQVYQRRVKQKPVLYQTSLGEKIGIRISMRLLVDTDETDLSGHSSAVSPNFIHSLDACALQETVLLAHQDGLTDFAMIHDSYGTLAADSARFAQLLRRAFVDMYKYNDVLTMWISSQPEAAVAKFTERPLEGKLDLEEIMNSQHFFA